MPHPRDMLEFNNSQLIILKSGYAALYRGDIVDQREYPEAELFTPEAVEKIILNLENENKILNS